MLSTVKEFMTKLSATFYQDDSLQQCLQTFVEKEMDGAMVLNSLDELVGVLTIKDPLKGAFFQKKTVGEVMTVPGVILHEDDRIDSVIHYRDEIHPVKDSNDKLTGYITRRQLFEGYSELNQEKLSLMDAIFNISRKKSPTSRNVKVR